MERTGQHVLVTGATGYIGGRLVPRLLEAGHAARCLVRDPRKLRDRPWGLDPRVEIAAGDMTDAGAVAKAMNGCASAYYLVHSMASAGAEYAARDEALAAAFAEAATTAGLSRIVYLGGLGELGDGLSEHLASRREVERVLASGRTPVTVLRAAMIIGSGSASFEILRYLVERLPLMVTPRWVTTECQPISIGNVLHYLVLALTHPATLGRTLDIGGPDVLSYHALMRVMAEERGLRRRLVIPLPVLTPRLSSLWIHLVTPISHRIAVPLTEGLRNRVVCRDHDAARLMPQRLLSVREAIREALDSVERADVETSWSMAGPVPGDPTGPGEPCSPTDARPRSRLLRPTSSGPSARSAAAAGGTPHAPSGNSAGSSIGCSGARVCATGGGIPTGSRSAKPSTSGASRGSSRDGGSRYGRR
jgi:uncharacterized protein YbjT (DUF2867 family)